MTLNTATLTTQHYTTTQGADGNFQSPNLTTAEKFSKYGRIDLQASGWQLTSDTVSTTEYESSRIDTHWHLPRRQKTLREQSKRNTLTFAKPAGSRIETREESNQIETHWHLPSQQDKWEWKEQKGAAALKPEHEVEISTATLGQDKAASISMPTGGSFYQWSHFRLDNNSLIRTRSTDKILADSPQNIFAEYCCISILGYTIKCYQRAERGNQNPCDPDSTQKKDRHKKVTNSAPNKSVLGKKCSSKEK